MRLIIRPEEPQAAFAVEMEEEGTVAELVERVKTGVHAVQRLTCFLRGIKVILSPSFPLLFYTLQDGDSVFSRSTASLSNAPQERLKDLDRLYLCRLLREVQQGTLPAFQRLLADYYLSATCSIDEDEQLVDQFGSGCWGCVHYASYFSHPEFLSYLIEVGANVNKESLDGWTPLQLATWKGHFECNSHSGVKVLLSCPNIEVDKMTSFRGSALHLASYKGFNAIAEALLDAHASMTLQDYKGRIPLQLAASQEIIEMIPKYMGAQILRKCGKADAAVPSLWDDVLEPPELYSGSLLLVEAVRERDREVYVELDVMQGEVRVFQGRDSRSEPETVVKLVEVQSLQLNETAVQPYLLLTHTTGRLKFHSSSSLQPWHTRLTHSHRLHLSKASPFSLFRISITEPAPPPLPPKPLHSEPVGDSIQLDWFDITEELGKGSFGCVYLARKKKTREVYALKALDKRALARDHQLKYALGECRILRQLDSPFIVRLYDSFQTPNRLYMLLEYCSGKDLGVLLESRGTVKQDEARFYTAEIILALEYLHDRDIMYRDLKPDNVLLDSTGHIKLADFGLAKENVTASRIAKSFCGSPAYLAPETLGKEGAGKAADVYGLGATLYELLTGQPPFYSEDLKELYQNIRVGKLELGKSMNSVLKDLLKSLLGHDPHQRPTLSQVKQHPFFRKINWTALSQRQVTPPFKPPPPNHSPAKHESPAKLLDKDYSVEPTLEECVLDFDH